MAGVAGSRVGGRVGGWVGSFPAPVDHPSLVSSTHVRQLTTTYNSSARGPSALYSIPRAPTCMCTNPHIDIHAMHLLKNKKIYTFFKIKI